MWCREPNHKAELRYMALTQEIVYSIRPTQIFLAPFWVVAWDICRKGSNWLYLFYLKQTVAKNGWVPPCMSLLMIICIRLYFSPSLFRRFPDYRWLENEGPAKIAELCHMRLSAEKMSDDFFVAKGAHHIEVASKYYTYSGESNKKKCHFLLRFMPPQTP